MAAFCKSHEGIKSCRHHRSLERGSSPRVAVLKSTLAGNLQVIVEPLRRYIARTLRTEIFPTAVRLSGQRRQRA